MAEHIRIGDVAPRVHYVADGTQSAFVFPFPIFESDDIELHVDGLHIRTGYAVSGAGNSDGGLLTFARPPAKGARVVLRRRLVMERVTDYQPNGVLRAKTLNDELDRQMAALQELREDHSGALRQSPGEAGGQFVLPLRSARANRLLGFDSIGNIAIFPRGEATLSAPFPGAIPRTVEDKLAERLSARDFGATGDGVTDDGPALQAAMNAAAASGKHLDIGEGTYRTTIPLTLPGAAAGLTMRGAILYAGLGGEAALTLGDGGDTRNRARLYQGLRVLRAILSSWEDERDIGILIRNQDSGLIDIRQVENFTIGVQTLGVERGFEDSVVHLGRIVDNRYGLDVRTASAAGWNTSVRYYGGHFAHSLATYPEKDRYGIRLSAAAGGYVAHNRHVFDGPAFELQSRDRPMDGIPFLIEVNSRAVIARNLRMEGCDPYVARHTAGAQDHVYEVAWASQGYAIGIDYTATATRVGSVVRAMHQAAAHREFTRSIAQVPNLRAAAIRWNAGQTGFEKLACLSSNVTGSPGLLQHFALPAQDSYVLTDRGVVLTGGRGLGFVVDARHCKEFALAVDADDPRMVVQCFGAGNALLTADHGEMVRASGMSLTYVPGARWWQGNADSNDTGLTRLQVFRLAPQVQTAIIGVVRVGTDYEVRSLRLACDPAFSPTVLYGTPELPHGTRDLKAEAVWDVPSIPAGGTAQINIPCPGAWPGDFVQAAFSLSTTGILFLAQVGAQDVITVTAWNRTAAPVDLAPGTVRVRAVKS
ncbi:glycosyl hydrolase family 28-related protein [Roseomonas xinghualingensis]|uniref:glycosyl hydrolase family 28-related protein n=1 Tax=Roseomonas xinghualingensis TaxID=2986475 RepID=UPI0021F21BAD|nr:glycosyl hydrolase family 28-related protein [Roseomonas sp. SXEYE001]MCV4206601.1 phage tail fiber protein [Roseomonas sp. SXEYE001]